MSRSEDRQRLQRARKHAPELWEGNDGKFYRDLFPENTEHVEALGELIAIYESATARLSALAKAPGESPYSALSVCSSPSDYVMEELRKPWSRGKRLYRVMLWGDRPTIMCSGRDDERKHSNEGQIAEVATFVAEALEKRAAALLNAAGNIRRDMAKHPKQYAQLPTLGEFMASKAKRRRNRRRAA